MPIDRTIALVGTDFCGSTLLSRLLWLCPGVAAVGEVHAYLRRGKRLYSGCDICGRSCPLLSGLKQKGISPNNLYSRVAAQLSDYRTMVISDKSPAVYSSTLQTWVAEPLVVFRSPAAHAASEVRHGRRTWDEGVRHWRNTYEQIEAIYPDAPVVSFANLVQDITVELGRVCDRLDLPAPGQVPFDLREIPWHHVGGSRSGRKLAALDVCRAVGSNRAVPEEAAILHARLQGRAL